MKKWLALFARSFELPHERKFSDAAIRTLSPSEYALLGLLIAIFSGSALFMLAGVSQAFSVQVPKEGGTLSEGMIGSPRYVNPVLASSDTDLSLTLLVYSGLMRATPEGDPVPDLAESFSISEDGRVYTFTLREGVVFHDGARVTADDVIATVRMVQDPLIKSPRRASWEGITAEATSDRVVTFTLPEAYAPFLENATLGILPKHLWGQVDWEQFPVSDLNVRAIGSGPFKVASVQRGKTGIVNAYELSAFSRYALGKPHLSKLKFRFFQNENELTSAYRKGDVEAISGVSGEAIAETGAREITAIPLSRIFAVFFNQNRREIFARQEVREALNAALDKEFIIDAVLAGYGIPIKSPIPPLLFPESAGEGQTETQNAEDILTSAGWERGEDGIWILKKKGGTERLAFTLATSNTPELSRTAEEIEKMWEKVGIEVNLEIYDPGTLNQNVIRPREYDALLFGEVIGRELDLYAFWHSSQRNDPGLNIALYANIETDALLSQARATIDRSERINLYRKFETEITKEVPAVFVYTPEFTYTLPRNVKGTNFMAITTPSERFLNSNEWYVETERLWTIFNN